MIKNKVNYSKYHGQLSASIVEAVENQRKAHGYGTYARRLHYWSSIIDRLSRLMAEDQILVKYGHKAPDKLGTEVLANVGTLIVSFLEFFDAIASDGENDLERFVIANNNAELIIDDDEDDDLNIAIQLQNVDPGKLRESVKRLVDTMKQEDTNGGYL